jgi:hypothetical protein
MITDYRDLYKQLAEKYNLTFEGTREAINYFWKHGVKRSIEKMVNQEVYISKLGSYKVKEYKIKYSIRDLKSYFNSPKFKEYHREHLTILLRQLEALQEQFNSINQDKKTFNELNGKTSRNLQEPKADLGGTEEQINQEGAC